MKKHMRFAILLSALALQGCTFFTISDNYGNRYGTFYDFGNKYLYQLATCEAAPGLVEATAANRPRWMQCCMWQHGVPIDDPNGCAAPPFFNG